MEWAASPELIGPTTSMSVKAVKAVRSFRLLFKLLRVHRRGLTEKLGEKISIGFSYLILYMICRPRSCRWEGGVLSLTRNSRSLGADAVPPSQGSIVSSMLSIPTETGFPVRTKRTALIHFAKEIASIPPPLTITSPPPSPTLLPPTPRAGSRYRCLFPCGQH